MGYAPPNVDWFKRLRRYEPNFGPTFHASDNRGFWLTLLRFIWS